MMKESHPEKHFKYCPQCGAKGAMNRERLSFYCNECNFHFFLNSAAAVTGIIQDPEQRILFTRRAFEPAKGKLDFPGGFVDPGENAVTALLRELKEELNLIPNEIYFIGSFANRYLFSGVDVNTCDMVFWCKGCKLEDLKVNDDVAAVEFFKLDDLNESEFSFDVINEIISKLKNYPGIHPV